MSIFGSHLDLKCGPFCVHFGPKIKSIFGPIFGSKKWATIAEMTIFDLNLGLIFGPKMKPFRAQFEPENGSFSSPKWIIFRPGKQNHFRAGKSFSSRKRNLKIQPEIKFRAGKENQIFILGRKRKFFLEPKNSQNRSKSAQKGLFLAQNGLKSA